MIVHEQTGDPYDAKNTWLYMSAVSEFVATARWIEASHRNDAFNGPSHHMQTVRIVHAESDDMDELRQWATLQRAMGCEPVRVFRTWTITANKRDNAFLEHVA